MNAMKLLENMINEKTVKMYCRDDIHKIENYEKAVADDKRWVCHHRLELTINNEYAHSPTELIQMGMYWKRPYFELIFMLQTDHIKMHQTAKNSFKGKIHSANSINAKKKWSKVKVGNAAMLYKTAKANGCTLKWNDWQKENKDVYK